LEKVMIAGKNNKGVGAFHVRTTPQSIQMIATVPKAKQWIK
jgi:hypothetical protein